MLHCTVPGCAGSYYVVRRHADADESYQISVDLKKSAANTDTASVAVVAVVTAQTVYGARHGLESLAQLVATPAGIISGVSHRDESQCARAIPGWVSREGGVWRSRSVVQSERGHHLSSTLCAQLTHAHAHTYNADAIARQCLMFHVCALKSFIPIRYFTLKIPRCIGGSIRPCAPLLPPPQIVQYEQSCF